MENVFVQTESPRRINVAVMARPEPDRDLLLQELESLRLKNSKLTEGLREVRASITDSQTTETAKEAPATSDIHQLHTNAVNAGAQVKSSVQGDGKERVLSLVFRYSHELLAPNASSKNEAGESPLSSPPSSPLSSPITDCLVPPPLSTPPLPSAPQAAGTEWIAAAT
ncbi:hypothetical protein AAF712_016871, partial [Marasmius tenuissimus]